MRKPSHKEGFRIIYSQFCAAIQFFNKKPTIKIMFLKNGATYTFLIRKQVKGSCFEKINNRKTCYRSVKLGKPPGTFATSNSLYE
jgi:hypothetical protein